MPESAEQRHFIGGIENSVPSLTRAARPQPKARTRRQIDVRCYFISGIENSAPSLTPDGQRVVIVLVLV